jgi:hypothetical protein
MTERSTEAVPGNSLAAGALLPPLASAALHAAASSSAPTNPWVRFQSELLHYAAYNLQAMWHA